MSVNLKSIQSSCSSDCDCNSGYCNEKKQCDYVKQISENMFGDVKCPKPPQCNNIPYSYQYNTESQSCAYDEINYNKIIVYYKNSSTSSEYFTPTSFNYGPVYEQVLSEGNTCTNSDLFCGPGLVCGANSVCIPFSNNSLVCPHYPPQANMGGGTYKFINGQCQYPVPSIQSGEWTNYVFNWGYGQGYSCAGDDECESGMTCLSGFCTPPPAQTEWYPRQNIGTSCTYNNQCISGICDAGNCTLIAPDSNGNCPENIASDPAYVYTNAGNNLGCIVKTITGYNNTSEYNSNDVTFNVDPEYNYVLPVDYEGCNNSQYSCPNGQICNNNVCTDFKSGSNNINGKCPIYSPNPIQNGNASYKPCFDTCYYPQVQQKLPGNPGNYGFFWKYPGGKGCKCNTKDDCYGCVGCNPSKVCSIYIGNECEGKFCQISKTIATNNPNPTC